jgi:hypothetical protein
MWFHRRPDGQPDGPDGEAELSAAWHDSDIADEVVAFLDAHAG